MELKPKGHQSLQIAKGPPCNTAILIDVRRSAALTYTHYTACMDNGQIYHFITVKIRYQSAFNNKETINYSVPRTA